MLSARVAYPLSERSAPPCKDGVTLSFDLECTVTTTATCGWTPRRSSPVRHSELSYQVVTDRYLLRNVDGGTQEGFRPWTRRWRASGTVEEWPIAVDSQLRSDEEWQISLRAGVRRGHMPDALRALMFWSDAWHRTSDWYTWTLVR